MLNDIQKSILKTVSDMTGIPDARLIGHPSRRTEGVHFPELRAYPDRLQDRLRTASTSGSRPLLKSENVHIPVVLSRAGFHDMVYNDFFVGEGAGRDSSWPGAASTTAATASSEHDGIHTFSHRQKRRRFTISKSTTAEGARVRSKRIPEPADHRRSAKRAPPSSWTISDTDRRRGRYEALIQSARPTARIPRCRSTKSFLTAGDQHALSAKWT